MKQIRSPCFSVKLIVKLLPIVEQLNCDLFEKMLTAILTNFAGQMIKPNFS